MTDRPQTGGIACHEEFLTWTFDAWRQEFRNILENRRREIQDRIEKIERDIEKKSDKKNVDVLVRGIHEELHRHADEINRLHSRVGEKLGTETMWKIAGFALAIGGSVGGLIGFLINLMMKVRP